MQVARRLAAGRIGVIPDPASEVLPCIRRSKPSTATRSRHARFLSAFFGVSRKSFAAMWWIFTVADPRSFLPSRPVPVITGCGQAPPSG